MRLHLLFTVYVLRGSLGSFSIVLGFGLRHCYLLPSFWDRCFSPVHRLRFHMLIRCSPVCPLVVLCIVHTD